MVWGGGSASLARDRRREGADVVTWPGADTATLVRADVPARSVEAVIGEEGLAAAESAARTWARLWGRVPLLDGESFRELVAWRDMSLLWLAEAFVRHETAGPACAGLAETALRLLEATRAEEVDGAGLGTPETVILSRACTVRGVLFHAATPTPRPLLPPPARRQGPARALRGVFAPASPPSLPAPWVPGRAGAAPLLVVAARESEARPLDPLLEAAAAHTGMPGVVLSVADLGRWETRRVREAVSEAEGRLRHQRDRLRGAPGLHQSHSHRDVGFADLAGNDLDRILLGRLPAAVRLLEAAIELLTGPTRPAVVALRGLPRDDRRTLVAACAVARVPAVVLHPAPVGAEDADREDGGPRAAATVVWEPGADPAPVVTRLQEAIVGPE